ncbi:Membrane protein involved in the export of O-antigen and teichoic acid [Mesobacillus persicus]|uniref:Membrane protein involved in the export of O-antigen and teichoic acid n=1 Tax=Mesobacillus persicus TaxID=930146 RepID=A0A1H8A6H5_9BACI|nr:oligosaccharide flippase family protein [Mesobacillus persicus]SEM66086.1 Membrane protein involved in the export of O-antigen and teichoic acid [Mesobacillus persicus]
MINKLNTQFTRNITLLMTGTAIAQVLTLLAAPVLSRLYTPASFGILSLFTAIISVLTSISTFKFELSIVLPKKTTDASQLLYLSIITTAAVSLLSLVISFSLIDSGLLQRLNIQEIEPFLLWIPVSILLIGMYNSLNYWSTRKKSFKRLSISQTVRSLGIVGGQLAGGLLKLGPVGLILGQILGQFLATFILSSQIFREDRRIFNSPKFIRMKELFKEYKEFPLYNAPQAFINSISQNAPAFILALYFSPTIVGFYAICIRFLMLPFNLIGESVRRVYFQKAAELENTQGNVFNLFKKVTLGLAAIAVIPIFLLITFGPDLFSVVLGREWEDAGIYARWMAISLFVGFFNIPSIVSIQMYKLQKYLLFYEVGLLVFRVVALVIGGIINNPLVSIISYSLVGFFFNSLLIAFVFYYFKVKYPYRGGNSE